MSSPTVRPAQRSWKRRVFHAVRRGHLYLGLFLIPWVILYGLTGVLFNHPNWFADQPVNPFTAAEIAGTPLEKLPTAQETAERAVQALNGNSASGYTLIHPEKIRYTRDFAFATATGDGQTHSLLIEVADGSGVIRSKASEPPPPEPAPFARKDMPIPEPIGDRVKDSLPELLARKGIRASDTKVTSVPDVSFFVQGPDGREWKATYNAFTGVLAGVPADTTGPELSSRRFLLRLHTIHGYPATNGPRWWWALIVDVTGFAMFFWALSGIVMWWQVKAARVLGAIMLISGLAAVTVMALGMHAAFTG